MLTRKIKVFLASASGATLVEYGIALLVVLIVGASSIVVLSDTVATELGETASAF